MPGNLQSALRERLAQALSEKDGAILGGTKTLHRCYDTDDNPLVTIEFDMKDESSDTQKYFALSDPIPETLQQGKGDTLVVDEPESKLHPGA